MSQKRFPESDILRIVVQACEALSYAHDNDTNHLDIKPQNFFVCADGSLKLGDFGVSIDRRKLEQVYGPEDMTGEVGTYPYMAPELFHGEEPTLKCDMWSFGCTVYEICMLRPAFQGKNKLALSQIIVDRILDEINGPYSENLKDLIYKLLDSDPAERPYAWTVLEMDFIVEFKKAELTQSFKLELPQGKLSKSGKHIVVGGEESHGNNSLSRGRTSPNTSFKEQTCNIASLLLSKRKMSSSKLFSDDGWDSLNDRSRSNDSSFRNPSLMSDPATERSNSPIKRFVPSIIVEHDSGQMSKEFSSPSQKKETRQSPYVMSPRDEENEQEQDEENINGTLSPLQKSSAKL